MKVGVNIAIIEDNRILLTRRKDFSVWCLPGGHVEIGESITQAATREAYEETGLTVELEHLIGIYSIPKAKAWVNLVILFSGKRIRGQIQVQENEVIEARFFHADEIPDHVLWGHRQRILDVFSGQNGVVWTQNVPFDAVANRLELYNLCEASGFSGEECYSKNFGWDDPKGDRKELG